MSQPTRNGRPDEEHELESAERAGMDAERIAEEWAERIGRWVLRTSARAKEEAEDIWAEAQALRREL